MPPNDAQAALDASRSLTVIREQLARATAAAKCHRCGCLHSTVETLAASDWGSELAGVLAAARAVFAPEAYDCLGCPVCFPAIAANALADAFPGMIAGAACSVEARGAEAGGAMRRAPRTAPTTEEPHARAGWPPLPGDYAVLTYRAPVAICTLGSAELLASFAEAAPPGVAIAGALRTENLGIERLIRNVLANPNIRFLILCGEDCAQAVGHWPGHSLASLFRGGLDERGRIIGANGRRPVLLNVTREEVGAFVRQVELLDLVGETSVARIASAALELAARDPGPFSEAVADAALVPVEAKPPRRLVPDPAGFFVVYPDAARRRLVLEHHTNEGVLDAVLEGAAPAALCAEAIARGLVSRLDHAAYLGRELARAEVCLSSGERYVQDRAAGEVDDEPRPAGGPSPDQPRACGCAGGCGGDR